MQQLLIISFVTFVFQGLTANSHSFNQELGKSIRPEAFPHCVVILAQLSESTPHKSRTTQNHARLSTFIHVSKSFVQSRYKKVYSWVIWFTTVRISPTCTEKHSWYIKKSLGNLIIKNTAQVIYQGARLALFSAFHRILIQLYSAFVWVQVDFNFSLLWIIFLAPEKLYYKKSPILVGSFKSSLLGLLALLIFKETFLKIIKKNELSLSRPAQVGTFF